MPERSNELEKLVNIITDLEISTELRTEAIETLGSIGTHKALLALLELGGNDRLIRKERDLALRQAQAIIQSGR